MHHQLLLSTNGNGRHDQGKGSIKTLLVHFVCLLLSGQKWYHWGPRHLRRPLMHYALILRIMTYCQVVTCYKVLVVLNVVWIIQHTPQLFEHVFFVFKHVLLHNSAADFIQPTDSVFISLVFSWKSLGHNWSSSSSTFISCMNREPRIASNTITEITLDFLEWKIVFDLK